MKIKKRTFSELCLAASIFVFIPVYFLQIYLFSGKRPFFDPLHVVLSAIVVVNSWLAWKMMPVAKRFFVFNASLAITFNFVLMFAKGRVEYAFFSLIGAMVFYLWYVMLGRAIESPYFQPRVKWWEEAPKPIFNLDSSAIPGDGERMTPCRISSISEKGCYLYLEEKGEFSKYTGPVTIHLSFMDKKCTYEGRIVTTLPERAGLGVRFNHYSMDDRYELNEFLNEMRRKGHEKNT